mgnify:CR=1 FL=1
MNTKLKSAAFDFEYDSFLDIACHSIFQTGNDFIYPNVDTALFNCCHVINQKYVGVGGHLFAIAADKSIEWGYEGAIHGFAAKLGCSK